MLDWLKDFIFNYKHIILILLLVVVGLTVYAYIQKYVMLQEEPKGDTDELNDIKRNISRLNNECSQLNNKCNQLNTQIKYGKINDSTKLPFIFEDALDNMRIDLYNFHILLYFSAL